MDGNGKTRVTMPEEYFIRTLSGIDIKKIPAPMDHNIYQLYELFDFYEFTLTSPSFYRNQVDKNNLNYYFSGAAVCPSVCLSANSQIR